MSIPRPAPATGSPASSSRMPRALYLAGYAQADIALDEQWTVTPGLRFDYFSLDADSASLDSRTESQLSPRLTISYRPQEQILLWAGWSQAFRSPSLTELYNDGTHFSVPGFALGPFVTFTGNNVFVPNPELKAETSNQFEIGGRFFERGPLGPGSTLTASGSLYYADVKDYVDQVVTFIDMDTMSGAFPAFTVSGTTTTRNIDAVLYGAEFELALDTPDWFGGIGIQVPRGEARDGSYLGSIPQDRVAMTLGWRPISDVEIGGRATFARGQDNVPDETNPGDGYSVFDVFASYQPGKGPLEGAIFSAGVDNILDRDFRIYPNELDQPGRTFKISAALEF
ncbi:MAG: TonB-dependent receptor domain-containing protein [Alphaproteobacteria bacterium]